LINLQSMKNEENGRKMQKKRVLKNVNIICIIADLPKNIENIAYPKKVVNKGGCHFAI